MKDPCDIDFGPEDNEDGIHPELLPVEDLEARLGHAHAILHPEPRSSQWHARRRDLHGVEQRLEQCVRFNDAHETYDITPYSEQYPVHPRRIVCVGPVTFGGMPEYRLLPKRSDPYTGETQPIMRRRKKDLFSRRLCPGICVACNVA